MSSSLNFDNSLADTEKYKYILNQLEYVVLREDNPLSSLANITAVLKQAFEKISWVGFYLYDGKKLFLGPFQGKLACTTIEPGKGVCGKSVVDKTAIVVKDVNEFPGHIACDPDSKSEIVIPIFKENKLFGVLDVDSSQKDSFNEIDQKYLEDICKYLSDNILVNYKELWQNF
jgi:GAF domain-containing protein